MMKIVGSCLVDRTQQYGLKVRMSPESKPEYVCIVWRNDKGAVIGMTKPGRFFPPAKAVAADFILSKDQKERAKLAAWESVAKIIHEVLKKASRWS